MHTLDTQSVILNSFVIVVMPLIIWANLRRAGLKSPVHEYLWRENTNLMRVALFILAMLTLFSASALLADFGFVSPEMEETLAMVVGIPFMFAAVAIIVLTVMGVMKAVRGWRAGGKAT